jgi:hypothetical protein
VGESLAQIYMRTARLVPAKVAEDRVEVPLRAAAGASFR